MERKTAHDFDQELLILFDAYVHGAIDRRGFLDKAAKYAVGGVTAAMLLDQLSPKFLEAQVVKPEDSRIKVQRVEYDSPKGYGKMRGYLAQPAKAAGKLPAVLVIHENRGLNPHIEDIARRLALDNFVAFAPDALFPLGGYPGDEDKARELFPKLDQVKTREDFVAAFDWLKANIWTQGSRWETPEFVRRASGTVGPISSARLFAAVCSSSSLWSDASRRACSMPPPISRGTNPSARRYHPVEPVTSVAFASSAARAPIGCAEFPSSPHPRASLCR